MPKSFFNLFNEARFCQWNTSYVLMVVNFFFLVIVKTWSIQQNKKTFYKLVKRRKRYKYSIRSVKIDPGAEVPTENNLLVGKITLLLKKTSETPKKYTIINIDEPKDGHHRQLITNILEERLKYLQSSQSK